MIRVMISGTLHADPQARTSQNGNTYAVAKVRADDKNGLWVWVSAIAFGHESERLLQLKAGDAVSIAGPAEIGAWLDKEGNAKPSVSLVAEKLICLRPKPRPPQEREAPRRHQQNHPPPVVAPAAPLDDLDDWQP